MDEEGHLKITDFGVSVQNLWLGEKIQEDCKTGTPSFMAPEVSLMSSLTKIMPELSYQILVKSNKWSITNTAF